MTLNNKLNLNQLSDMELQQMREIISSHQMMISKFNDYTKECNDPQLKQMFKQSAESAQKTVDNLTQSL